MTSLPAERQGGIEKVRAVLQKHLPEGYEVQFTYGMIGYVVPHSHHPQGS